MFLLSSGKYVLKIPRNECGIADNLHESCVSGIYHNARCRTINLFGTTCLVMEYLKPAGYEDDLPDWTGFVDCCQVGYNRNGKLLAYDFGIC